MDKMKCDSERERPRIDVNESFKVYTHHEYAKKWQRTKYRLHGGGFFLPRLNWCRREWKKAAGVHWIALLRFVLQLSWLAWQLNWLVFVVRRVNINCWLSLFTITLFIANSNSINADMCGCKWHRLLFTMTTRPQPHFWRFFLSSAVRWIFFSVFRSNWTN